MGQYSIVMGVVNSELEWAWQAGVVNDEEAPPQSE